MIPAAVISTRTAIPSPGASVLTLIVFWNGADVTKAFGWAADNAGCYYYRIAQPLDQLAVSYGWEVSHGTTFGGKEALDAKASNPEFLKIIERAASAYDVVIAQRVSMTNPSIFWQSIRKTKAKTFLVYELDDDLFSIEHKSNPTGHEFYSQEVTRANLADNINLADRVTVSTWGLAEVVSKYNNDVHICPNGIPEWLLSHNRPHVDNGLITIGWGGSATHQMDFTEAGGSLRRLFANSDNIEFHTIGANYVSEPTALDLVRGVPIRKSVAKIPADQVRITGWSENVEDYYRTIDFDIAIAPLKSHVFNRSKSYIKALEYAALGIPVVASDVGPYREFVQHGVTGYLVRQEHEWVKYLRELINDPAARAEMGANARRLAAEYTTAKLAPLWLAALSPEGK